jgi:S1-C subfamily serine protease
MGCLLRGAHCALIESLEVPMSNEASILSRFSDELELRLAEAKGLVVAIRNSSHEHVTGLLWQPDVVVTSEQAIGDREEYEIVTTAGEATKARIAGRDSGTNLLVLRPERALPVQPRASGAARTGALALAIGANAAGEPSARCGIVHTVGPQWYSRSGGRIEQRIALDIRLGRTEEGGPVLDADGLLLGMSTLGPPGEILMIPYATIERIVPQLSREGRVQRGWLGLALRPVAVPDALREAAQQAAGMMVMSIVAEGPAANAGIVAGDILLTINGVSARGTRRLAAQLDEGSVGTTVALRLIRGGEVLALETMVAARR